jgi:hypothetical protein
MVLKVITFEADRSLMAVFNKHRYMVLCISSDVGLTNHQPQRLKLQR